MNTLIYFSDSFRATPARSVDVTFLARKIFFGKKGQSGAQNVTKVKLGYCFLHGLGKPMDQIRARIFEIGNCYMEGFGTDENYKIGITFLKKAAEKGNAKAMNLLGVCYLNGKGIKQNFDKAAIYFKNAAKADNKLGKINLAQCYIEGKGVLLNQEKGYQLLQEIHEDPAAKFRIGVCLYNGAGVNANKKEGLKLLSEAVFQKDKNAANSNNIDALREISRIYHEGDGVPVDLDKAEDYNQIVKQLAGGHVHTDMFEPAFVPRKKKKTHKLDKRKINVLRKSLRLKK